MLGRFFTNRDALVALTKGRPPAYGRLDLTDHLAKGPTKRILSFDGGGVRIGIAIAIAERIEDVLRRRHGNKANFRLADYYDLIGGTSTGGILAALLAAKSFAASDLYAIFDELTRVTFARGGTLGEASSDKSFNSKKLHHFLVDIFGKTLMNDPQMATGLAILTRRVDEDVTWVMHNNPKGKFFHDTVESARIGHKHFPIANALRATAGLPGSFVPQDIELTRAPARVSGLFVDGTISPHHNPAFQLFLLATLKGNGFEWEKGANRLSITSVGTGTYSSTFTPSQSRKLTPSTMRQEALLQMMDGADRSSELVMQLLADPQSSSWSDTTLIEGVKQAALTEKPQINYQRFQAKIDPASIRREFGVALSGSQVKKLRSMSDRDGFQIGYEIGQAIAESKVKDANFAAQFDLHAEPPVEEETTPGKKRPGKKSRVRTTATAMGTMPLPTLAKSPSVRRT